MLERKPRGYTAEQEADEDLKSDVCPSGSPMEGGGCSHPDTGQQGNRLPGERPGPRKERDWESTGVRKTRMMTQQQALGETQVALSIKKA